MVETEVPKGYKQTGIGIIPEDWDLKKLINCVKENLDYGINAPATTFSDYLPTYLRITDISDEGYFIKNKKVSVDNVDSKNFYLKKNDLVFARTGASVGKTYLYDIRDGPLVFAGFLIRARIDNKILNPVFLKFLTQTKKYWNWVNLMSMRSGQPGINSNEYSQLLIPLPPKAEQEAITKVLSDTDDLIQSTEQLIEKKKKVKEGTMQQLLTGKKRLEGFNEEWEEKTLPELIWFQEGPGLRNWQFTNKGIKVVNVTNLVNGYLNLNNTQRYISINEFNKMYKHFEIDENDILIASSGNSYCKVSIVRKEDLPLLMNTSVIRFKPKNKINYNFMLVYLKSKLFKEQIDFMITGGAQPNFGPYHLNKVIIKLPKNLEEQEAIANILSDMDNEIDTLQQKLNKYQKIKEGMMQQLLTGKIRLI